jgi:hypothetical protein
MSEKVLTEVEKKLKTLDWTIKYFKEISENINEANQHNFNIHINNSRDLQPINKIGKMSPIGQRQEGPERMVIALEDWTNNGKEFK